LGPVLTGKETAVFFLADSENACVPRIFGGSVRKPPSNEETQMPVRERIEIDEVSLPVGSAGLRVPPVAYALALYLAGVGILVARSYLLAKHHFVYPLDDAYIHMAIGKNFARHGVWGVTPFGFTSATSSPLFELLLAFGYVFAGPVAWLPLLLGLTFGGAAIFVADRMLPSWSKLRIPALLALVVFTPLPCVAVIGMEHTVHIFLTLTFAWRASLVIADRRKWDNWLLAVGPLLVLTRYEGLYLVASVALLMIIRRLYRLATVCVCASVIPVVVYGLLSMAKGWYFLPDSVLIKGAHYHSILGPVLHAENLLLRAPTLLGLLVVLSVLLATPTIARWSYAYVLLALSTLTLLMHVATADVGGLFRYEAYLIALAIIATANALALIKFKRSEVPWVLLLATAGALSLRTSVDFIDIPRMSDFIYSQQHQMAQFIARYYPGSSVAVNDIGEVDYVSDIHLLDLAGLAEPKIAQAKNSNAYTTALIRKEGLEHGTQIAIVHGNWFTNPKISQYGPPLPTSWHCVGRWYSTDPAPRVDRSVSFYATSPGEAARLRQNLKEFALRLPKPTLPLPCSAATQSSGGSPLIASRLGPQ
jgi:hypothetical protein